MQFRKTSLGRDNGNESDASPQIS
uniref:Uncharacterized protein n=1 Tax=Arundo donax TaxID=35708 RepID=A0A0A9CEP7_ARUDO